ncbi:MAG: prolipoprotein diacylglyceryl transferase [Candidatus Wallbacteria bacterium]|nr:prolipoprotein diacylglyceryl transferase [Candidatus Wallbacteria bacterium]
MNTVQCCPQNWGVLPVLFHFGNVLISSYFVFIGLGLMAALASYYLEFRREPQRNAQLLPLVFFAFAGGVIGAKLPMWIINFKAIIAGGFAPELIFPGKTIVGGLIGGTIAVRIAKRQMGIKTRMGNSIAPAIAIGLAVARIGCFLQGCCFGRPTLLPWGVNFGDGIMRHPTQLYESLFMFVLFFLLIRKSRNNPAPGELFDFLMAMYFGFRFFEEFLRASDIVFIGLTGYQLVSLPLASWFGLRLNSSLIFRKGKEESP